MRLHLTLATLTLACAATAAPVISEIFYKPPGAIEPVAQEWIELFNPDIAPVDVSGWALTKGVSFTIPAATTIPAGGYLVVAANVAAFNAANPGFTGTVIGGWTGQLANGGEQIQLNDALGNKVNDVAYADQGEWALRGRGVLSFSHKGWDWFCGADGDGYSFELRNPALGNGSGQNWGVSAAIGGSPGAANSAASTNIAPLIKDAKHKPEIPSSTESVVVSVNLEDEAAGAMATLHWRLDAGTWATLSMTDTDGDGDVEATIPAQANLAVVEWYVSATDGTNTRTWPAPARTSDVGVLPETFGQVTNALYQVDNSFDANATFLAPADNQTFRLIMTDAERAELLQIGTTPGQEDSEATMNGTVITHDGTGVSSRYLAGIRNRGQASALGPPNNYHVSFRSDDLWNGRSSVAMNCQYGYSQALGQALMQRAGLATQESVIVKVRVNGADLAQTGAVMFGRYVRLEGRGSDWAKAHFPNDPDGNFYRLDDHAPGTNGVPAGNIDRGEFRYEGTDPLSYADTYYKETNKEENDFSDLANFTRVVSADPVTSAPGQPAISDAAYPAAVAAVLDLEEFYRFIATDALIGNQEGGLQSGRCDDASIYRGVLDPRFKFIPHDLDDVFDIGGGVGNPITRSLFSYDESVQQGNTGVVGLRRLFNHPALVPRYYSAVLDAMNTWFTNATVDPIVDQIMAGWVPAGTGAASPARTVAAIKAYVGQRRANVLAQIQQAYSLAVTTTGADIEGSKRTNDGAATFSGTFNVARTYSITVNGVAAQWFYRTAGADAAGTWKLTVPAGGGSVLSPGSNQVVVRFWDGLGGTGNIVNELTARVFWQPVSATYTNVSGTLAPSGSLAMTVPANYIPGVPFLVKMDLKDGAGNIDRTAWNRTATLTATNGVTLNPASVTLTNGTGSALVTVGSSGGGATTQLIQPGGTLAAPNATAPQWRMLDTGGEPAAAWKSSTTFADTAWTLGLLQAGAGDADERTVLNNVPSGTTTRRAFYFRKVFTVADPSAFNALEIRAVVDDGAVFYLNGTQVAIDNVAASPTITTPATINRSGAAEAAINTYNITAFLSALVPGDNLLAVEIHNYHATGSPSNDLSFDCELRATSPGSGTDPGNFALTGTIGSLNTSKSITSLTPTPAMTNVSGTLPAGTTNWSGVMNVTGDVTVPSGATLNIAAGTHILVAGDSTAGSSAGSDIIVATGGVVNATGTATQPISITASTATTRWGEINVNGSTTTWQYCLISRAAHSPGGGHTGTGPAFRLGNGAVWTFEDGAITDLPGKTLTNTGNTTMTMRRSHFARCVMGPETDGSAITIEDCNFSEMLPAYRESGGPDDEDCIYIHDSGGRPVNLRRSVFANSGDDGIDLLAGAVTIEDCIVRNILDKGMSLLQNNVTVRRTQIVDCDFGISTKTQIGSEATPYTLTMENVTIVGESHPTNQGDQSGGVYWHNVGVHVRNKYGTGPNAQLIVNAKNCIISAITPMLNDYGTVGNDFPLLTSSYNCYEDVTGTNPVDPRPAGTGDIAAVPLFVNAAAKDFHLQATSPARDTGDPASPLDADSSRADMGALPYGVGGATTGALVWTPAGGPYRVTAAATVPVGLTLTIQPGTAVYFDQNVRLTVNGKIEALGTADKRITFSHVPGTVAAGDADPIKNGTQTGAPKWGGIRVVNSMSVESVFKYCDFINAQGTSPSTDNQGSLGIVRSWAFCEGLTFSGSHLRMLYGRNPKLTVIRSTFPDMMLFDPVLGRIEDPTDFVAGTDNNMEPMKVEYPVDADSTGPAWTSNGLPIGGWWRVYYNQFNGNRGHNDVFDADSGSMAIAGDFLLDCRYNHFRGLSGDEHIDLGGDAYIASNIFEAATKDEWVSAFGTDNGYSNAISSGDKGTGTTIFVVRNICYDLDHVINCKAGTAAVFEHNTVANLHADYLYTPSTPDQAVKNAPINFFVPEDGSNPTRGDGAYMGYNIVSNTPRLFSGPDARKINGTTIVNDVTTKIEFYHNLLDQIGDLVVGPNHPQSALSGAYGPNVAGLPRFSNPAGEDYGIQVTSDGRRSAFGGLDYGATVPEWAYIIGGPTGTTDATGATFTIGGPGIIAYKWRLNGGAWSAPETIGTGGPFPRTVGVPCVRQEALVISGLTPGTHTLEVLGQDMAGNWQDADPARSAIGAAQAGPTVRTWAVDSSATLVRINEVLANSATLADQVELHNYGTVPVTLTGWALTDDVLAPAKYLLPSTTIPAGGFAAFSSALLNLDKDGDAVHLFQGATLRDSVAFGAQIPDLTIGRVIIDNALVWKLGTQTLGAANNWVITADLSGIRISEWFAGGSVLYDNDWLELSNSQAFPVDLSGLRITDNRAGAPAQHIVPPLSFIAANGFVKLIADGTGGNHLSFSLSGQQDDISLYDASGALLDTVQFFVQTDDISQGRDGSGLTQYELPTAGLANTTTDANALALLRGLRISEVMFNALGGQDFEYVELTNIGATPLQLQNLKFVQGITFTFTAPTTLGAGESIVVAKNLTKFRSRYGNAPLVAGTYTGNLDNSGETLALQLPPPFDANILTFAYGDSWRLSADGGGTALTTLPGITKASLWADKDTWAATALGGSPAGSGARTDTFSGWMTLNGVNAVGDDNDFDGVPALIESALGMNPQNGNGTHGIAGTPIAGTGATYTFYVPENASAAQGHGVTDLVYTVQSRPDLLAGVWTTIATKSFGTNWTGTVSLGAPVSGFIPVTVTDPSGGPQRFFHLTITWAP